MAAPIALSISVVIISIIAYGIHDLLTNFEDNGCEMTYMFEYPEYQKIDIGEATQDFPKYGLHIYGEGAYGNRIRNLQLSGIPVLFIPGNSGSHKQVRSLGSVALRMAERERGKGHFNYFVVEINEELSGLYGGVLKKQTDFVHLCLKKILTFYKKAKHPPTSVVLVGHSMGGIVARGLFTLPDFDPALVNTIITQATPHQKPVVSLDQDLFVYYDRVNRYWRSEAGQAALRHVTVVSTGGGHRDIQVRYALTRLNGIVAADRAVSASTTAVPKSWVSTDHRCAVWCRQMVLLTQRALFDIVDPSTSQISQDADLRMKVFKHHFLSNNALPNYLTHANDTLKLDLKAQWEIKGERSWTFMSRKITGNMYFAVPLKVEEKSDSIMVMSNLTNPEWLCYCEIPKGKTSCETCTSLSAYSRLLPPLYSNTKYARISFTDFEVTDNTHIVISVPAGQKKVSITSDRYNSDERHLVYHLPSGWDSVVSYPISATDGAAMLRIRNQSLFYSLHLSGLYLPTTAYKAQVLPHSCRKHSAESNEGSVLRLNIPWSHEETYSFASYGKAASLAIKVQTPRPPSLAWDWHLDDSAEPHLEMFLHPYCHYQLKLLASAPDGLGQLVRFYGPLVPAYLVAVLLVVIGEVLIATGKGQAVTTSPPETFVRFSNPHYLVGFVMVLKFLLGISPVRRLVSSFLSADDSRLLEQEGLYFLMLPAVLCVCACAGVYLQTTGAFHFLSLLSYGGRLLCCVPESVSNHMKAFQVALSVVAMLMTSLCGTAGLLLSAGLLILKVLQLLYLIGRRLDSRETHANLSLLFPVTLLVNLQALLSMASLIMWLKSEALLTPLNPDPSRLPGLLTSASVCVLLFYDDLALSRTSDRLCGWILLVLAVRSVMYASESLYRLPYLTSLALTLLLLSRLANRFTGPSQAEGKNE